MKRRGAGHGAIGEDCLASLNGDVLVLNAGSSSIKFSLFGGGDGLARVARGVIDGIGGAGRMRTFDAGGASMADDPTAGPQPLDHARALALVLDWAGAREDGHGIAAAGHRVVHGGTAYTAPVRVDAQVLERLDALTPLAPLHQPHNVGAIRALARVRPGLAQVACFDTAFHCTQAPQAQRYALPHAIRASGIRRYGFHGLSYEYIASRLPEVAPAHADGRVVVAHLGNGASLCALRARRSVDSTMGLTALDGLPMGTRCGALDPGVVLYLVGERGMSVEEVTDLLYHRSGLLGVSGISNDMRTLLADTRPAAREAVELFVYRIARELGAMAAVLGGLDALVFTGGIGEHAAPVRAGVCALARWLGVHVDEAANTADAACISRPDSAVAVYVIPTDEESMIARHTRELLARDAAQRPGTQRAEA